MNYRKILNDATPKIIVAINAILYFLINLIKSIVKVIFQQVGGGGQ